MKERVTLTLDQNVLSQLDSKVDGFQIKNRSHAVELFLLKALGSGVKKAFLLAGGKGTRLKPITHELPKPMVPLHDKPMIEHTFDLLKKYGITDILISIGYKGEKIREYFGDGKKFGVRLTYIVEHEPLGTAGPLHLAKNHLTDTFVMCNADILQHVDLNDMFMFHTENHAKATIALTTVEDPSNYGVAKLQGNKILDFIEKPKNSESKLINSGLYILDPSIIDYVPQGNASIERDVFPKLAKEGHLFGYPFSGQWFDIGTLDRYEKAIKEWKDVEM